MGQTETVMADENPTGIAVLGCQLVDDILVRSSFRNIIFNCEKKLLMIQDLLLHSL